MIEMIMKYSQGNPGAVQFLMEMINDLEHAVVIAIKLEAIPSLKGTNLYVLWSDLCNKDMSLVAKLCKDCPNDILADACSRQDYSGRKLVKPYLID